MKSAQGTQQILRARASPRLALVLLVLVLAVEIAPIAFFWCAQGVWPLKNFEDFSTAFWPPLKVAYAPSFYFNQSGFYFGALLKLIHAFTDAVTGSRHITLHHFQVFGYATRAAFALLTVGVFALYLHKEPGRVSAVLAAGMIISFRLATPWIFSIYHMRIGLQLSYLLFILVISLASLSLAKGFVEGRSPPRSALYAMGFLNGATFLEAPHFLPFFLPAFAFAVAQPEGVILRLAHALRWAVGVPVGIFAGLVLFYGSDGRSAVAAFVSISHGIVGGFPQGQPGFGQFMSVKLDPGSDYFLVKIVLLLQAAAVAIFSIVTAASWSSLPGRLRYAGFVVAGSFAAAWGLDIHVWRTHGSYTTVFALVYFGILLEAVIIDIVWREKDRSRGSRWKWATAIIALLSLAPCVITMAGLRLSGFFSYVRAEGTAFRSFNDFLGRLPKPLGLAVNDDISYFPLAAHCNFAEIFFHAGSGFQLAEDARYGEQIRNDRFPDFRLLYFVHTTAVTYDLARAALVREYELGWPTPAPEAVLVPVPRALASKSGTAWEKKARAIPPGLVPADTSLPHFLLQHPDAGIAWQAPDSLPWSVLPLAADPLSAEIQAKVWPLAWNPENRIFYLITTTEGVYLLGLRRAPEPLPAVRSPGPYGALRIRLRFPHFQAAVAEPVVTTGAEQAGDIVYVVYVDPAHIRFGLDHWFRGGPFSPPIAVDYSKDHRIEISMGSLYPGEGDPYFSRTPPSTVAALKNSIHVSLDGSLVFLSLLKCYESSPNEVAVGRNAINGSSCNPRFTGEILESSRVGPSLR